MRVRHKRVMITALVLGLCIAGCGKDKDAGESSGKQYATFAEAVIHGDAADVKRHLAGNADPNEKIEVGSGEGGVITGKADGKLIKADPRLVAIILGHNDVVQALLDHGVDPNRRIGKLVGGMAISATPVTAAINECNAAILKLLLEKGAKLGPRSLMTAAAAGDVACVELLISKGADVNAKDDIGRTAMDFARQNKHDEVMAVLRKHGAKDNSNKAKPITEPETTKSKKAEPATSEKPDKASLIALKLAVLKHELQKAAAADKQKSKKVNYVLRDEDHLEELLAALKGNDPAVSKGLSAKKDPATGKIVLPPFRQFKVSFEKVGAESAKVIVSEFGNARTGRTAVSVWTTSWRKKSDKWELVK